MTEGSRHIDETIPYEDYLPHTRLSRRISAIFGAIGEAISWVWLLLLGIIVLNVTMRYVFGQGRVEFEEIQWHLYAVGFLFGLSVCLDHDNHIRVDILHTRLTYRQRAWIELYGLLLLFLPFVTLVVVFAVPFVSYSFATAEISDAPGGLPFRWIIKGALPIAFLFLLAAGLGRLLRVTAYLFGTPSALPSAAEDPRRADVD